MYLCLVSSAREELYSLPYTSSTVMGVCFTIDFVVLLTILSMFYQLHREQQTFIGSSVYLFMAWLLLFGINLGGYKMFVWFLAQLGGKMGISCAEWNKLLSFHEGMHVKNDNCLQKRHLRCVHESRGMADIHSLKNVNFQIHGGTSTLHQDGDGLLSVVSQGRKDKEAADRQKSESRVFLPFVGWQSLISY